MRPADAASSVATQEGAALVYSLENARSLIGVALIVQAVDGHSGGTISVRLLLGVLFLAAGVGRLYAEVKRGRGA